MRRLLDDSEWWVLRFGLSEPRVSNSSLPLLRSLTSSLESLMGDRDGRRLRSRLRSLPRSLGLSSWCAMGLDWRGLRSRGLDSLSPSRRRGDLDLVGRVTPLSTLPRSLRSSLWLQLSFISTYRAGECFPGGMVLLFNVQRTKCGPRRPLAKSPYPCRGWKPQVA